MTFCSCRKSSKTRPRGKDLSHGPLPLGIPTPSGDQNGGCGPLFGFSPGGLILRWKTAIPASVLGFGLVRYESACVERGFWFVRIGVAYFFLSAIALRSRWRLCRLTDAAYPLRVLRAFGADAVRGCWGGRYTFLLLLQGVLTCRFVKSTPSSERHP